MVVESGGNGGGKGVICYCEGHCPGDLENGTCWARPGSKCFTAVEEFYNSETNTMDLEISYGCLPPDEQGIMQCNSNKTPHQVGKAIECCDYTDYCNKDLRPAYQPRSTPSPPSIISIQDMVPFIVLVVSVTICFIVLFVIILYVYLRYKKREDILRPYFYIGSKKNPPQTQTIQNLIEMTSGSGSGLPFLVQRTIAKQMDMLNIVGRGKYGEVWFAKWREEKVAAKVFYTTDEASWVRETEIYQTVLMRHENVLGFIASDIKGNGCTQMLLITDYHEFGSLYDYLQRTALEPSSLLTLALSAASGLSHLHTEFFGTRGKSALAHRDIKSKNILVNRDRQCVIADFGLAVRYISEKNEIDIAPNPKSGTRRYMAPEILDETLDVRAFDAYKMADMYSMSLVYWEMCRRCGTTTEGGDTYYIEMEDPAIPYHDVVPNDPSFEDMYDVVCVKKLRPIIPARWNSNEVLRCLSKIMQECWHSSPGARLSSLRVKKTLCNLRNNDFTIII